MGRWKKIQVEVLAREEYSDRIRRYIPRPNIGGRPAASWVMGYAGTGADEGEDAKIVVSRNTRAASRVAPNRNVLHVKVWEAAQKLPVQEKGVEERVNELLHGGDDDHVSCGSDLLSGEDSEEFFVKALRAESTLQLWVSCIGPYVNIIDKCLVSVWGGE